ncbi:MAG: hypothetical protein AB7H93_21050 [Vicinamibacterales bacterium]
MNYPWRHYGGDFGPTVWGSHHGVTTAPAEIAADFAALAAHGVEVVRWFLFTDARGGLRVDAAGWPAGLDPTAIADLDAALDTAAAHDVRVVPVLFDHTLAFRATVMAGALVGGHHRWLADPDGQARVLNRVLSPVVSRYAPGGARADLAGAIDAWDLLNEPDWIVAELSPSPRLDRPIPFDVFAAWVRDAAAVVHGHGARVTLGSARLRFAGWWDDPVLGLDYLQAHCYYDPAHDFDVAATPAAALGLRRPLVVGECAGQGDAADLARGRPALDVRALAAVARRGGYAGLWPWSWRGVDGHGAVARESLAAIAADSRELAPGYRIPTGATSDSGQRSPS